jgi:hypothetical protein
VGVVRWDLKVELKIEQAAASRKKDECAWGPCAVRLIDKVMIVLYHFQSLAHYYRSFC